MSNVTIMRLLLPLMNRQVVSHNSRVRLLRTCRRSLAFFDQPNAVSCSQGQ